MKLHEIKALPTDEEITNMFKPELYGLKTKLPIHPTIAVNQFKHEYAAPLREQLVRAYMVIELFSGVIEEMVKFDNQGIDFNPKEHFDEAQKILDGKEGKK
jgi:hypothetical protein